MLSYSAQALIGESTNNDEGKLPEYQLFITEREVPVILLKEIAGTGEWQWFSSHESLLDDIFLMISTVIFYEIHIDAPEKLSLLDTFTEKERFDFYEMVKKNSRLWKKKIYLNIFDTSHIEENLENLKEYHCDMEITTTRFLKEWQPGSNEIREKGSVY